MRASVSVEDAAPKGRKLTGYRDRPNASNEDSSLAWGALVSRTMATQTTFESRESIRFPRKFHSGGAERQVAGLGVFRILQISPQRVTLVGHDPEHVGHAPG